MNQIQFNSILYTPHELNSQRQTPEHFVYMTEPDDTIQDILTRYKLTPEMLLQLNPDLCLAPNQLLKLPKF